ncbi:MAG: acetate/propionate family kinase [Panacagrimonas sp.]
MNSLIVLTLNSGSSSLKFGVHRLKAAGNETLLAESVSGEDELFARISRRIDESRLPALDAIGHRIVHGGAKLRQPCLIDDAVLAELEAATAFAPLHMPAALALIRAAREHFPGVPQMACFDTGFHSEMPDVSRVLPVARELRAEGIQRYGFHGLSCESIMHQLGPALPERLVIAHLGNGASVTAVKGGRSIDTSMGLTPAGGVIMGTRSGDLDPGVLLYLMRQNRFDAAMCEDLVNHRSGLLGVSGVSSDMRRLHEAATSNADARLAIEMFSHSVRKQIAAMIAVLDGIDRLVFTGGIGENDAEVRAAICSGLSWIGVRLDPARNRLASSAPNKASFGPIHDSASRCSVQVLVSQEDAQIARHTRALLQAVTGNSP